LLFRRIGDSFMAQPALRAIRLAMPDARIAVVTEPQCARVFRGLRYVDEVRELSHSKGPLSFVKALRADGRPDVTLDFMSNPRTAVASLLSGAGSRVGIDYRGRGWLYTQRISVQNPAAPVYSAIHKLQLATIIGATSQDYSTDLSLSESDHEFAERMLTELSHDATLPLVAFFVHSRRTYKRWDCRHYASVMSHIRADGMATPLLLCTPGDEAAVAAVADGAKLAPDSVLRISDLGQLGALLSRMTLYVGNDGGPKHVAVAVGTRTVTLFGTEPPEYWTPPDPDRHVAITSQVAGETSPNTLDGISPEQVLKEVRLALARAIT
jgi:heptosyltransferase-2